MANEIEVKDLSAIHYVLGFSNSQEYRHARDGQDYYLALSRILEYLRDKRKYSELQPESWTEIEQHVWEIVNEWGIGNTFLEG